jgi:hypothetical protein
MLTSTITAVQMLHPTTTCQGTSGRRAPFCRRNNNTKAPSHQGPCNVQGQSPHCRASQMAASWMQPLPLHPPSSSLPQPSLLQQPPHWQLCVSSQTPPKFQRLSRPLELHCNLRPINISHNAVLVSLLLLLKQGGHTLNQTLRLVSINRVARNTRLKHLNGGLANT